MQNKTAKSFCILPVVNFPHLITIRCTQFCTMPCSALTEFTRLLLLTRTYMHGVILQTSRDGYNFITHKQINPLTIWPTLCHSAAHEMLPRFEYKKTKYSAFLRHCSAFSTSFRSFSRIPILHFSRCELSAFYRTSRVRVSCLLWLIQNGATSSVLPITMKMTYLLKNFLCFCSF